MRRALRTRKITELVGGDPPDQRPDGDGVDADGEVRASAHAQPESFNPARVAPARDYIFLLKAPNSRRPEAVAREAWFVPECCS